MYTEERDKPFNDVAAGQMVASSGNIQRKKSGTKVSPYEPIRLQEMMEMMPPPMDSSMDEILAAFDKDLDKIDTRFSEKTKTQQGLCLGWTSECLSEQRRFAHEIAVECQLREAEALSSSDDDEDVVDPLPLGFRPPKPKYAPAHVRSGGPTDYSSQSRQIVCYRCGGTGHIARDCDLT